jgi:hypothetical protein
MRKLLLKLCTTALVATSLAAANLQAAELHVMSSGGFTAAYKALGPQSRSAPSIRAKRRRCSITLRRPAYRPK